MYRIICTDVYIPITYDLISCVLNNCVCSHGKHFYRTVSRTIFCCTECSVCLLTPQKLYVNILFSFVSLPASIAQSLIIPAYSRYYLFCGTLIDFAILTGSNSKTPEQLRLFHTAYNAFQRLNKQIINLNLSLCFL